MPVTPTYPGVYIEEVPSGVRTIAGVSTSVTAFIDYFHRGPLDQAVQIFSVADFERDFGGLDALSQASYGIQQFFLNGGSEAWVVRVATPAARAASIVLRDVTGATGVLRASAGRRIKGNAVDDPGEWGNLVRLDVDYDTSAAVPNSFNLAVSEVQLSNGRTVVVRTEVYRNLTMAPGKNYAVDVVNESSQMVQLTQLTVSPDPTLPAQTGTVSTALPVSLAAIAPGAQFNVDPGTGTRIATITGSAAAPRDFRPLLENAIRAANPADPLLAGATVQLIGNQFRVLAGRAGNNYTPQTRLTFTEVGIGTTVATMRLNVTPNVQQYALGGATLASQVADVTGDNGGAPTATELRGLPANKTGLYALEDVDIFNILCLPSAADLPDTQMSTVYAEAETYCEGRRAFLLVDIPGDQNTVPEIRDWLDQHATLRHRNAALYFPRPRIADPLNDFRLFSVPASGTVAGLYARTDVARGVWKAPAGVDATLRNVQELDYKLTDNENGALNPLGINCLRNFPVYGNICWGARTLDGSDQQASEWKYIPVRRLALFLEESLYRGTKWVVFEPNDEPLWAQIRLNVGAFMQNLFRQGAFQGRTPREAYLVKCDSETTNQTDINSGIVNIVVGFAPLKPAEFVIIKISQLAGQIQT